MLIFMVIGGDGDGAGLEGGFGREGPVFGAAEEGFMGDGCWWFSNLAKPDTGPALSLGARARGKLVSNGR